ncbi:hypothetical protein Tco_1116768, partial [Tanacetum coccineum]
MTFELDGPATNLKLTVVKIAGILKGSTKDVKEDESMQTHDPLEVSGRNRKRFNAIQFKTRFKPQRVKVESDRKLVVNLTKEDWQKWFQIINDLGAVVGTLEVLKDTIGLADAELKEDRLKDDRVHDLSMPGGYDMEEKAARANFMTLKDCLGLLLSFKSDGEMYDKDCFFKDRLCLLKKLMWIGKRGFVPTRCLMKVLRELDL